MEKYQYIVSDNFATGEGTTINLMIVPIHYDMKYIETLFVKVIDFYYWGNAKNVTKEEFLQYSHYVPISVQKIINEEVTPPGNFIWYSSFHVNY